MELKERTQDYFETRKLEDIFDTAVWIIIEDPELLDGASTSEAGLMFEEWLKKEKKIKSLEILGDIAAVCPRYEYFIHGNEASVESVVNDIIARKPEGYYFTLIHFSNIMENKDQHKEEDEEDNANLEMTKKDLFDDNQHIEKRFRADQYVGVYAELFDLDN
ncbi:hypothetical protein BP6252_06517 [Coleophoma cylindrospora]|uniref:Uncharacterized protein n=1 Tax=Coleophoma cylindrospora TaxID=1849047 RepID=A0A3D8RMU4_9HELO|nr:hypothetical protein BP6252_06517 [Coleophoma cylindrospora]